ncbi:hypothetical protein [Actinomycetospora sp. NBRC 106378]|uniref:hypothetical protein n=1 Tax=Actinomycetospora sp. NBRC 106378 TaxID=3032208 RepID=UPI0024A55174|nr:hypothetical protein [Actinomycetospora sp. NBRC 106378]GLZ51761.1 hypothetical protein Acsp07_13780 [Actinomycetospora sp. NBRC 106378]
MSRRAALGLGVGLGAAGGVALLAGCGSPAPTTDPAALPDVRNTVSTVWSNRPDGPMPAVGDEGTPFTVVLTGAPQRPTVADGALVGNLPRPGAIYVGQQLAAPVRRLGARFGFGTGDAGGALALVAFTDEQPPRANLHLSLTSDRWILGVVADGGVDEVARDFYATPVPTDGTPVQGEVRLAGTTAFVAVPDGSVRRVDDPRFGAVAGSIATWEFFKLTPDSSDVRMYATWAG